MNHQSIWRRLFVYFSLVMLVVLTSCPRTHEVTFLYNDGDRQMDTQSKSFMGRRFPNRMLPQLMDTPLTDGC